MLGLLVWATTTVDFLHSWDWTQDFVYAGQGLCSVGMLLSRLLLKSDLNLSWIQWVVSKLSSAWIDAKCVRRLLLDRGINADFILFPTQCLLPGQTVHPWETIISIFKVRETAAGSGRMCQAGLSFGSDCVRCNLCWPTLVGCSSRCSGPWGITS